MGAILTGFLPELHDVHMIPSLPACEAPPGLSELMGRSCRVYSQLT